jgi:hypothetical protein
MWRRLLEWVVRRLNPFCPEPKCNRMMRLRRCKIDLGIAPCPFCKGTESKAYVLTVQKKGMRRCMRCRNDFYPQRREGFARFWICPEHPWQRFRAGAEVIMAKEKPKNYRELQELVSIKTPFQTRKGRMPNV